MTAPHGNVPVPAAPRGGVRTAIQQATPRTWLFDDNVPEHALDVVPNHSTCKLLAVLPSYVLDTYVHVDPSTDH